MVSGMIEMIVMISINLTRLGEEEDMLLHGW